MPANGTRDHETFADEEMFDFGTAEGRVTMTLDPVTHYCEMSALAALLKWAERIDEYVTVDLTEDEATMYRLACQLRVQYAADKF